MNLIKILVLVVVGLQFTRVDGATTILAYVIKGKDPYSIWTTDRGPSGKEEIVFEELSLWLDCYVVITVEPIRFEDKISIMYEPESRAYVLKGGLFESEGLMILDNREDRLLEDIDGILKSYTAENDGSMRRR